MFEQAKCEHISTISEDKLEGQDQNYNLSGHQGRTRHRKHPSEKNNRHNYIGVGERREDQSCQRLDFY